MAGQDAPAQVRSKRRGANQAARARAVLDRPPQSQGWNTTDEEEITLRRWRGRTEITALEVLEPRQTVFGTFRVKSESGSSYEVEIRSLEQHANSCGCIDHRVNGLGACKHIEGVLAVLRQQDAKAFGSAAASGNPRVEIYLDRRDTARPAVLLPASGAATKSVCNWLDPFTNRDGELNADPGKIAALLSAWQSAPAQIRRTIRVSRHLNPWLERQQRQRSRIKAREKFIGEVERGKASFDLVKLPLLPYQRDGMLHLAFGERALLADEMGLGDSAGDRRLRAACPAQGHHEGAGGVPGFAQGGVGRADRAVHRSSGKIHFRTSRSKTVRLPPARLLQHRQL